MKDVIIYKNLEGKYVTLPEYLEAAKKRAEEAKAEAAEGIAAESSDATEAAADSEGTEAGETADTAESKESKEDTPVEKDVVYYVTDEKQQSQYINMFKEAGMDAVFMTHNIDNPFITQLEQENDKVRFQRIDADLTGTLKEETGEEELKAIQDALTAMFRKTLGKDKLEVRVEKLKNANVSAVITLSEESRRMQEMMKMYGMSGMSMGDFGGQETLVLNANNNLVQYVFAHPKTKNAPIICEQLYDLAMLSHRPLEPEAMTRFVERTNQIMTLLTK